jgi:transcriptional regulator with PAS, ATPase and Fis domain
LSLDAAILRHIQMVLELNHGNKLRASRQLNISRSTLYRLLGGESADIQAPSTP